MKWPWLLLGLSGCLRVSAEGGPVFTDFEGLLPDQLRPGGQLLWDFQGAVRDTRLTGFRDVAGEVSAALDPYPADVDCDPDSKYFTERSVTLIGDGAGGLALGTVEYAFHERLATVASDDTLWDVFCGRTVVGTASGASSVCGEVPYVRRLRDGLPGEVALPADCGLGWWLGVGPDPGTAVLLDGDGVVYDLFEDSEVRVVPSALALDPRLDRAGLVWLGAPDAAHLVGVAYDGTWRYVTTGGELREAAGISGAPAGAAPVERQPDGTLRVVTTEGLYVWDAEGTGVVDTLDTSAWVGLSGSWYGGTFVVTNESNELDPTLDVPIAIQARAVDGDVFVELDVPTTPCVTTEACRAVGESRFVGLAGDPGAYHAVYEFWSWYLGPGGTDFRAIFSAPVPVR